MTIVYVDASRAVLTFDVWLTWDQEDAWRACLEFVAEVGPSVALEVLGEVEDEPSPPPGKRRRA
jgi:hypothetical protein